jgi:hypothetical protein
MMVFTSDHGMAFSGGKTTVYEGGLRVPMVVRNPYEKQRGVESEAMVSHIDITPTLLDFAGGLDHTKNAPKKLTNANRFWRERGENLKENRDGGESLEHCSSIALSVRLGPMGGEQLAGSVGKRNGRSVWQHNGEGLRPAARV